MDGSAWVHDSFPTVDDIRIDINLESFLNLLGYEWP